MPGDCKDCVQIQHVEEKISELREQIKELKMKDADNAKRIGDLERKSDVTTERFDRIFEAIEAIESNIKTIADALQSVNLKSSKTYEKLVFEVLKYIVIAGVAAAITKMIN